MNTEAHEANSVREQPGAGIETPAPAAPRTGFTPFPKTDDPKSKQFTGRATQGEADRITEAIEARKQPGKTYDIVRLALDMMDHIGGDWLNTFQLKKKR